GLAVLAGLPARAVRPGREDRYVGVRQPRRDRRSRGRLRRLAGPGPGDDQAAGRRTRDGRNAHGSQRLTPPPPRSPCLARGPLPAAARRLPPLPAASRLPPRGLGAVFGP